MHHIDRAPNQRFRIEQYVPYLRDNGVALTFSPLLSKEDDAVFYRPGNLFKKMQIVLRSIRKRRRDLQRASQFDAVLIIREALFIGPPRIERKLRKKGLTVIYDFDDAIWKLDVSRANRWFGFLKFPGKTAAIIRLADKVIAGNEYLADYAKAFNPNVHIIPTTVETRTFLPGKKDASSPVVIGWSGSLTTIKHFRIAVPVLKKLREHYSDRIRFKVIGHAGFSEEELGIRGTAWSSERELEELQEIDIGIMPLPDDEWSKGKCGLKGLVYMSIGIPSVMSPVGVNTQIIRHGENGFLAGTEAEWFEILSRLIENPELRKQIGSSGRQTVVESYSVLANQENYLNILGNRL